MSSVTAIDISIIYLACGAPFGVYRAYLPKENWYSVVLAIVAWPIIAIRLVLTTAQRSSISIHHALQELRTDLERGLFAGSSPETVFEFREVFDRYTGLYIAARQASTPAVSGLIQITNHPSLALAESCISRSLDSKLRRHLNVARSEFTSLLSPNSSEDVELATQKLRELLGDPQLLASPPQLNATPEPLRTAAHVG